jgi:hypothetical protein
MATFSVYPQHSNIGGPTWCVTHVEHVTGGHHRLSVQHNGPGDSIRYLAPTHYVSFSHIDATGLVRVGSVQRMPDGTTSVRAIGHTPVDDNPYTGPREPVAPMSEHLQKLIEAHCRDHEKTPWYVLADAVSEEYHDLQPHVDSHFVARNNS